MQTRSQTRKQQLLKRERESVLARDRNFADEKLKFYKEKLDNIHENPDVNSSYLNDEPWIWNFNRKNYEYWMDIIAGLENGHTIEEQVEIKKKRNEELKSKDASCTVSGGRRYKRTIKRRKLTKRRNLKSRKVK
jgi:hypothetical protein